MAEMKTTRRNLYREQNQGNDVDRIMSHDQDEDEIETRTRIKTRTRTRTRMWTWTRTRIRGTINTTVLSTSNVAGVTMTL